MAAVVRAVLAVQDFVRSSVKTLVEAEINPLLATPGDAAAADALIRMGAPE